MESLLSKISAYHLISYALTGLILCAIYIEAHGKETNGHPILIFGTVYVVGLIVSRIGSIILERPLRKLGFIKYAKYRDFVIAELKDPKVSGLAEQAAFYRTLSTGFLLLALISLFDGLPVKTAFFKGYQETGIYVLIMLLFAFSYRKQCDFVAQRVKVGVEKSSDG